MEVNCTLEPAACCREHQAASSSFGTHSPRQRLNRLWSCLQTGKKPSLVLSTNQTVQCYRSYKPDGMYSTHSAAFISNPCDHPHPCIYGTSLRRSQNCLEKFQHTNCEKIHESTPTVGRIHAPTWERGFLPLANKDSSAFSVRQMWSTSNTRGRVLLVHLWLAEERKAVYFPLTPEINPQPPGFVSQWLSEHKFLDVECYQPSSILTRDRFGLGKEEA